MGVAAPPPGCRKSSIRSRPKGFNIKCIMNEYDDLDIYNADPVHDGWVDFDYNENTGELPDCFEDSDIETFINNLND